MLIYCPDINCQRDTLVCIFNCKLNIKCPLYYKRYEDIKAEVIEIKYLEKYGEPEYPIPLELIRKQKNLEKKEKLDAKKAIEREKRDKKKQKELEKKQKELELQKKKKAREQKKIDKENSKGKRKRRTREEIRANLDLIMGLDKVCTNKAPEVVPELVQKRKRKVLSPAVAGTLKPEVVQAAIQTVKKSRAEKFANFFEVKEDVPVENIQPKKRHRRTKLEIEADRKATEGVEFFL